MSFEKFNFNLKINKRFYIAEKLNSIKRKV